MSCMRTSDCVGPHLQRDSVTCCMEAQLRPRLAKCKQAALQRER